MIGKKSLKIQFHKRSYTKTGHKNSYKIIFVDCGMKKQLFDYEIRAKYRKLIETISSAEAKRILMKGSEEAEPVEKERLAAILKK